MGLGWLDALGSKAGPRLNLQLVIATEWLHPQAAEPCAKAFRPVPVINALFSMLFSQCLSHNASLSIQLLPFQTCLHQYFTETQRMTTLGLVNRLFL